MRRTDLDRAIDYAAELIEERGWVPHMTYRGADVRLSAFTALVWAAEAIRGPGAQSTDFMTEVLDTVCLYATGQRCGTMRNGRPVSVSRWEARTERVGNSLLPGHAAMTQDEILATLRGCAREVRVGDGRLPLGVRAPDAPIMTPSRGFQTAPDSRL